MPEQNTRNAVQVKRLKYAAGFDLGDYIHFLAASPSRKVARILSGSSNGQALLVDSDAQLVIRQWQAHEADVLCGDFSKDGEYQGRYFATGGQDGLVHVYDALSGEQLATCQAGTRSNWVEHLAWSPHAPILATAAGKMLKIWQADGSLVFAFDLHDNTIAGLGWHPVLKNQLATTSYNGLRRFEVGNPKPIRSFHWKGSSLKLYWSPDGKHIASATQDSTVHVWNVKSGDDVQMPGYPIKPTMQTWHPTGCYLATGGSDSIVIWDFAGKGPAGSTPMVLQGHQDYVHALACQHDGELIASGAQDGVVFTWNASLSKEPQDVFEFPDEEIRHLAWSADDQYLIAATHLGNIYLLIRK